MSNDPAEMRNKRRLYHEAGAAEFWLCNEQGEMSFFSAEGPLDRSAFCPVFPSDMKIPD